MFYLKNNKHRISIALTIVIIGMIVATFLALEIYERKKYRSTAEKDIDIWRAVLYSDLVIRRPNAKFAFRFYGVEGEPLYQADLKLNNLGLISLRDYSKKKGSDEFRIVVLGGEQSASSVANISWPDALEDQLNREFSGANFRVLNFAWPDAGPEHYIEYWKNEVAQYSPDLVIINSPETDFYRTIQGANPTLRGKELVLSQDYRFQVDATRFLIRVAVTKDNKKEINLANENVIASRPYGIFSDGAPTPIDVISDSQLIKKVQRKLVEDQITASMPAFGTFTLNKIGITKSTVLPVSQVRNFDAVAPATIQDDIITAEFGVKVFGWMRRNIPNVMFIHNFHAGEIATDFRHTRKMNELDPNIQVIDMRNYLQTNISKEELSSWYMIPHMGEKFSDKGHLAYANLVANMLCDKEKLPVHRCDNGRK